MRPSPSPKNFFHGFHRIGCLSAFIIHLSLSQDHCTLDNVAGSPNWLEVLASHLAGPRMPSTDARRVGIMRPRQSLSCIVCRRRKIRCGKEQPACANCVRFNETCKYETDKPDLASRQAKRKHTSAPERGELTVSPPATEHSGWTAQQRHSPPSHTFNLDPRIEAAPSSNHLIVSHYTVPASSSTNRQYGSSTHGSHRLFSQTPSDFGNTFLPSAEPQDPSLVSKSTPLWNASSQEDREHALQLGPQSLSTNTTEDNGILTTPKRRRTAESHATVNSQDAVLDDRAGIRNRSTASVDCATSDTGEDIFWPVSYLSVQKGGRTRHVGNAFWGLIKGHVSPLLIIGPLFFVGHY